MLTRSLEILTELQGYWPRASHWLRALKRAAFPVQSESDKRDRVASVEEGMSSQPVRSPDSISISLAFDSVRV